APLCSKEAERRCQVLWIGTSERSYYVECERLTRYGSEDKVGTFATETRSFGWRHLTLSHEPLL
ncbi:MAG: hypothetical protein R6X31_03535, partial [Anaerolineae bacterium]